MKVRKNVKNLSATEKRDFAKAINLLKGEPSIVNPGVQSRYDDFVQVHLDTMNAAIDWSHGDSAFFPWHREMLYQFERELDRMVPGVTIPYWDWTRHQAPTVSPGVLDQGFPFQHDFIGVDGDDATNDEVQREPGAATPYPYEFDPVNWQVVVKDEAGDSSRLRRAFGERSTAPNLPENDSVVTGVSTSFRQALASTSYLQLRQRSEGDHHNLVHRWVGGNMGQMTSPNDPVFFMHHAAIDRMWTIWQERNPGLSPYEHVTGLPGHRLNDSMIFNFAGNPAPWSDITRPADVINNHTMHGDGVWYETDLPEIVLEPTPTIDFGAVPEGMTHYRAAHFRVRTYRPLRFRITGFPDTATTHFDVTPLGTEIPVIPAGHGDPVDVYVWFQFTASSPSPDASVVIEADFADDEGYYAANEGDFYSLGTYNLTLTATVQPREDNAVVMVLDRSFSMNSPAGGGSSRSQLMKNAVGVFHSLLAANDEIGVVSFDDLVDDLLPLTTQSAGLGTTLTGPGLDPRGNTAIGQGIQLGSTMLSGASHSNRSMLVLTDGNQNVEPYVEDLPSGTITNRTYAIGFGLPGHVSDYVLNQITQNTGGDLMITGELTSLDEQFLLTKYFVQILAGVTNANIVLDPEGKLTWGAEHTVGFQVAETELEVDVILLTPLPNIIRFWLETPTHKLIRPEDVSTLPNVAYRVGENLAFYRMKLPALPGDSRHSHAGKWIAHLEFASREEIKKQLSSNEEHQLELREILKHGTLPYQVVAYARSNLNFTASLQQQSLEPGATIRLEAGLREYGVAYRGVAEVRAEVTRPDKSVFTLQLNQHEPGHYHTTFVATSAGLYRIRMLVRGATSSGDTFTREKTLTATFFAGGNRPRFDPSPGINAKGDDGFICRLLSCLLSDDSVLHWLKKHELDADALRKCLEHTCRGAGPAASGTAVVNEPLSHSDIPRVVSMIRRELLAADPQQILSRPVDPIVPKPPEPATKRLAPENRPEPFAMPEEAARLMKREKRSKKK